MKKINFNLRNMVSQRITRNGSDVYIEYRSGISKWDKKLSQYLAQSCEFDTDEYQKFKYHRYVQKSYVPTPLRAPITTWEQTQTFLLNIYIYFFLPSSVPSHNQL